MMQLIEEFTDFAVYEHSTGKGVIIVQVKGRGNNGAIFPDVNQALEKALAMAWGGSLSLTHRFKNPATANQGEATK